MAAEARAKEQREGRKFYPRAIDGLAMYEIVSPFGGKPPLPLQGTYTSEEYAQSAIDRYASTGR